jgi:hypothetical protein
MHSIADDLEVKSGLARLKRYLACWRLFRELDQLTHPRRPSNREGP